MKRKLILGILTLTMVAGLLSGCGKKAAETDKIRTGTLALLNSSEKDYAKVQDMTKTLIEDIEAGKAPEEVMEGKLESDKSEGDADVVNTEFVYFDDLTSMIMGLNSGDIQEVQVYSSIGRYICASNSSLQMEDLYDEVTKEEAKQVIETMYSDGFSFMLSEANAELRGELDKAITDMKNDGTLDRLVKEQIEDVIDGKEPVSIEMEKIDGADTVKVAVTGDLPPLDYISPDGKPGGFNTAVLAEIGKRIGKNIELVNINSGARSVALSSGNVDVVFWTRNSVEGIAPEGEPGEGAVLPDGEDPMEMREIPSDLPEKPDDASIGGMSLDEYKKRDMPAGTIATMPYFTDHFVTLKKK